MVFTKRIDRAFQWAGEKMGSEAKTTHSEEFKMLEAEMNLRHDGSFFHSMPTWHPFPSLANFLQAWTAFKGP